MACFVQPMRSAVVVVAALLGGVASQSLYVPNVPLHNAAVPGSVMPAMGLGTGGYGSNPLVVRVAGGLLCWLAPGHLR